MNTKRWAMNTLRVAAALSALASAWGCDAQKGAGEHTRGIRETGYLTCGSAPDDCGEELACTDLDGEQSCVAPPADCADLTCACLGRYLCGATACVEGEGPTVTCTGRFPEAGADGGAFVGSIVLDNVPALRTFLAGNYSEVTGDLTVAIAGYEGTLAFPSLVAVRGRLLLEDSDALASLELPALEQVQALVIKGNNLLQSVDLPRLVASGSDVPPYIEVDGNGSLAALRLGSLTRLQTARLQDNPLTELGLDSLERVDRDLDVSVASETLTLPRLRRVGGGLGFNRNANLTYLSLPELEVVGGFFFLGYSPLADFDLPRLQRVGTFAIEMCPAIPLCLAQRVLEQADVGRWRWRDADLAQNCDCGDGWEDRVACP